jgi:hypothetical protein
LRSHNSAVFTIGTNVEPPEIRYGGTVMLVPVQLRPFQVASVAEYVPVPWMRSRQPVGLDEPHRERYGVMSKDRGDRPLAPPRCMMAASPAAFRNIAHP